MLIPLKGLCFTLPSITHAKYVWTFMILHFGCLTSLSLRDHPYFQHFHESTGVCYGEGV